MSDRFIVIASNRGPVSYDIDEQGELVATRGGGGLVTALTGVLGGTGGTWLASAMSEGDHRAAADAPDGRLEILEEDSKLNIRYLTPEPEAFDRAYNVISNRVLWFLHHYLFDVPRSPRFGAAIARAWTDYVAMNEQFAGALAEEGQAAAEEPAFLVQDYHLSLVPGMLRARRPDAVIAHFSHTPFTGPDYFRILPDYMCGELLRGMLGADVLGFQSEDWAENFLLCCRGFGDARVDMRRRHVDLEGRRTLVRVYPVSVDPAALREQSHSPEVRAIRKEIRAWLGDSRLILRVDRSELSKNILRGFLAHEAFLLRYPQWRGRVRFLAQLTPSRRAIPEYRAYTRDCLRTAERINRDLGSEDWTPIEVHVREDLPRAIAAYGLYDVLVVNPVFDGMNLVAMEGPTVNRRDGVLILSRNAGAHSLLGKHAIELNPFDVQQTADALNQALTMSPDERARRAQGLRRAVRAHPPERWVVNQLEDLERAVAARS